MRFRAAVLVAAAWLVAAAADAGEFRLLSELKARDHGGRLSFQELSGDGIPELIRSDGLNLLNSGTAGLNLKLARIYRIQDHGWIAQQAFVHRIEGNEMQFFPDPNPFPEKYNVVHRMLGDFNSDGTADELFAGPADKGEAEVQDAPYVFRLLQHGEMLFEDELYTMCTACPRFSRFQTIDLDGDGVQEVLVWLVNYGLVDRVRIYGRSERAWSGEKTFDFPQELGEALGYVSGVQAAVPKPPSPVEIVVKDLNYDYERRKSIWVNGSTCRYELEFKAVNEGQKIDLAHWRTYFCEWAIPYVQGPLTVKGTFGEVMEIRDSTLKIEGDKVCIETEFKHFSGDRMSPGLYEFWLECPYVEQAPNSFGWFGTLRTSRSQIWLYDEMPPREVPQ